MRSHHYIGLAWPLAQCFSQIKSYFCVLLTHNILAYLRPRSPGLVIALNIKIRPPTATFWKHDPVSLFSKLLNFKQKPVSVFLEKPCAFSFKGWIVLEGLLKMHHRVYRITREMIFYGRVCLSRLTWNYVYFGLKTVFFFCVTVWYLHVFHFGLRGTCWHVLWPWVLSRMLGRVSSILVWPADSAHWLRVYLIS